MVSGERGIGPVVLFYIILTPATCWMESYVFVLLLYEHLNFVIVYLLKNITKYTVLT